MRTTDPHTFPPVSSDDIERIAELSAAVGWPHRRPDIDLLVQLGRGRTVCHPERRVMDGIGLYWNFGDTIARLGMIIIAPELQGLGLGRRLVEALLEDTGTRSLALLSTEAGRNLYASLGFSPVDAVRQHQGCYEDNSAEDSGVRDASAEDLHRIAELDRQAFGIDRSFVLTALSSVGETMILEGDGTLTGYGMARRFGKGRVIGPLVASKEEDAIRLFRALARPGFIRVDSPASAELLNRHLTTVGLTPAGADSAVMVRGRWPSPIGGSRVFALSSHALG
ncbi:MAG: GNAT family N-acetyltransferase [Pseudomonadota bacterium]